MFRILDLFSGIGGFAYAAKRVWGEELEIVSFCERDIYARFILNKHWPDIPIIEDIFNLNGDEYGTIDLICGGFPCQPFSPVGKRKGKKDDRYLWPEMFRVIKETRPRWIIGENVINFISMAFNQTQFDLESENYEVYPVIIPACAINAPHKRDRVWIIAHTISTRCLQRKYKKYTEQKKLHPINSKIIADNADKKRYNFKDTSSCHRNNDGLSNRLYRNKQGRFPEILPEEIWNEPKGIENFEPKITNKNSLIDYRSQRIKMLGNAIVPQVAEVIFNYIKIIDSEITGEFKNGNKK